MMNKPRVRIRNGKPILTEVSTPRPNPDLIKHLARLTKEAEKGEIKSMFYVCAHHGDWISDGRCLDYRAPATLMLGQITLAARRLAATIDDEY
jgi:hypothetical protein